ncbi:MAG: HAD family hydrolase [Actinomycetota bacterium]
MSAPVDAVVFDLYGTLVPEFPRTAFYETVAHMAATLGADTAAFRAEWDRTAVGRQSGVYAGGMPGNLRAVCATLGMPTPSDDALEAALAPRAAMYRRWFHPREGSLEVLSALRERSMPTALISMCAPDTPAMWRASPLAGFVDAEVFSSEVGLRKPDAAIYRYATDRLGVSPEACLYCGDGAYGELTGATAVGMRAYLIRPPDLNVAESLTPEREEDWRGPVVSDLRELLALV